MRTHQLRQDLLLIIGCVCVYLILSELTSAYFNAFILFLIITMAAFLFSFSREKNNTGSRLFIVFLAITILEVISLLYYRINVMEADELPRYNHGRTAYWIEDKLLGYKPVPSSSVPVRKKVGDSIIYNTEYTFTADGLRTTKSYNNSQCSFLFFGGRNMFGEGLPDIQTLPYQFSRKLNYNYNVLNYGFHGYGPHHMLRKLESGLSNISNPSLAVIFYWLTPEDIDKVSGNYEPFRKGPKYIFINGDLTYVGGLSGMGGILNSAYDFVQGLILFSRNSQLVNLAIGSAHNNFSDQKKKDELLSGILSKVNKLARETYNSRLVLILETKSSLGRQVLSEINRSNIDFIDLDDVLTQERENYFLYQDKLNFNGKLNNELSTVLANRYGDC